MVLLEEGLAYYRPQAQSHPLPVQGRFCFLCGAFMLQWQRGVVTLETLWPAKSKIFPIWPVTERLADHSVLFINSHGMNFFLKTLKKYALSFIEYIACGHFLSLVLRAEGIKVKRVLLELTSIIRNTVYLTSSI